MSLKSAKGKMEGVAKVGFNGEEVRSDKERRTTAGAKDSWSESTAKSLYRLPT
jgi:hypothetical protein